MVREAKQLEDTIFNHGDKLINGGKVKKVQPTRGLQSFLDDVVKPQTSNHKASTVKSVKTTLKRIVKRTPEVMVKVTGGGNSMGKIQAHMTYISRNGQLEAEDQDGNKVKGKEEIQETADEWQMSGDPISDEESKYKQAFNIVLSMPKGTNEQAVYEAAKEFAKQHFEDHKYLMVQHTYSNDPNKKPSENPHVHIVVKAVSDKGVRLNPRKDDLQAWRESFAEKLRERGVEANATKRIHRMQKTRGNKQAVHQMKAKGKRFNKYGQGKASPERVDNAKQQEKEAIHHYKKLSQALAQGDQDDRKLAVDIVDYLSKQLKVDPNKNIDKSKQERDQVKPKGIDR
ncbi:relaxase/mobilization nuclease domain-containing protein [Acinetobacter calcoaceticus]|uniref:relaxase/mobilization nuclease domain-containing protein n=1 Tax=Acinetobacter calcoaceticus TaxID=471 RepID=UPI00124E0F5B|nr:ABC transporter permease [Acinetobacter calcoaceticus]